MDHGIEPADGKGFKHPVLSEIQGIRERLSQAEGDSFLPDPKRAEVAMGWRKKTAQEGLSEGKALRAKAPRSSWASWSPDAARQDILDLLESQEKSRVSELLPIRHERMGASPFTFFRGNALGMARDLSTFPCSGIGVQACGDAHVANFGMFASPDRRLVFDINDFDETSYGPWEWDVARLAASLEVFGRDRGFDAAARTRIVKAAVSSYREAIQSFTQMGNLDLWYARLDYEESVRNRLQEESTSGAKASTVKKNTKQAEKFIAKAKRKNSARALTKFTRLEEGELKIISDPPLVVPIAELGKGYDAAVLNAVLNAILVGYRKSLPLDRRLLLARYHYVDCARKVVGVGSVGTRCWIIVLQGRDEKDSLVLQVKEAEESVLERYTHRNVFLNHGQRVVEGQRLMQASSDLLLGWIRAPGLDKRPHDFYVRQLWDWKSSFDLETIQDEMIIDMAGKCGWTLARAHARSGDRFALAGYLGTGQAFDKGMVEFASAYADLNEKDYERFKEACDSGRFSLPGKEG